MKTAIQSILVVIAVVLMSIGYEKLTQMKDGQKPGAHEANSQDSWSYKEPIDKVTGEKTYRATRTVSLDIGGTAKMTANCESFGNGNRLVISIVFFDKNGTGIDVDPIGFKKSDSASFRYSESQG